MLAGAINRSVLNVQLTSNEVCSHPNTYESAGHIVHLNHTDQTDLPVLCPQDLSKHNLQ